MSKTFKRIALVASVALTLGGVSAVSASAANGTNALIYVQTADGVTSAANSAGDTYLTSGVGVAGPVNTVQVHVIADAGDYTATTGAARSTTGHAYILTVEGAGATFTKSSDASVVLNTTGTQASAADGASAANLTVSTPTAGTVTVKIYQESTAGIYSSTAAETVTFTIGAAGVSNVLSTALSTVYGVSGDASAAGTTVDSITATTDAALAVSADKAGSINTPVMSFKVVQKDGNGLALTTPKAVSVTTTIGNIETITVGSAKSVAQGSYYSATPASATSYYGISPDGRSGVATVTVSINGVAVKTFSVTFYSTTVASVAATATHAYVSYAVPTFVSTDLTQVAGYTTAEYNVCATAKDSDGNVILASGKLTAKSSDTTIATVSSSADYASTTTGKNCWTVTGVKAGVASITIRDAATTLITSSVDVNVTSPIAATAVLALDADTYEPGALVTYTITAKNAAGTPIPDGKYIGFLAAAETNNGGATALTSIGVDAKFTAGVAKGTFYAPANSFTVKATLGEASTQAAAIQDAVLTASATVNSAATTAAQAAIDAAQEATDAANAAYDAANNAMDSADAATAAAQEASDNAAAALAAVTELATTVANLVAKVNSIAATLAKIAKKVKA